MSWDSDLSFSIAMRKYADDIYKFVFPITHITRFDRDDHQAHILDKEFHIDTVLELTNGMILTLQEKFLRDKFASFDCFTLEYRNNRNTGENGEWNKLCTDLYFTGYGNEKDGFISAYLFNVLSIKLAILQDKLQGTLKTTTTSNANFYAYPFSEFSEEWFIYKKPYQAGT